MLQTLLLPLDDTELLGINHICRVKRQDEIEVEDEEKNKSIVENGAIVSLSNGEEIVIDSDQTDSIFEYAYEQIDLMEKLKEKMQ